MPKKPSKKSRQKKYHPDGFHTVPKWCIGTRGAAKLGRYATVLVLVATDVVNLHAYGTSVRAFIAMEQCLRVLRAVEILHERGALVFDLAIFRAATQILQQQLASTTGVKLEDDELTLLVDAARAVNDLFHYFPEAQIRAAFNQATVEHRRAVGNCTVVQDAQYWLMLAAGIPADEADS